METSVEGSSLSVAVVVADVFGPRYLSINGDMTGHFHGIIHFMVFLCEMAGHFCVISFRNGEMTGNFYGIVHSIIGCLLYSTYHWHIDAQSLHGFDQFDPLMFFGSFAYNIKNSINSERY